MKTSAKVVLILYSSVALSVNGAVYYVSTSGNDSFPGTSPSQPWKSCSKVESKMSLFTSDASNEPVYIYFDNDDIWLNEDLNITCIGTAANWIIFDGAAWGGKPAGTSRATLRRTTPTTKVLAGLKYGNGTYSQDAFIILQGFELDGNDLVDNNIMDSINANYVKILNNVIHDPLTGEGKYTPTLFFSTTGDVAGHIEIHDLEVSNNELYGGGAHGVAFYPRTGSNRSTDLDNIANITVTNNIIHDYGNSPSSSYGSGVQVMSCVGGLIAGNVIYDGYGSSDGFGINLDTRNRRCSDITISGNLIYGGPGQELCAGFASVGGVNIDLINNVFINTSYSAINWGAAVGGSTGRIINNTIYNSGRDAINISSTSWVDALHNNVIYLSQNVRAINRGDRISVHSHNNFYNAVAGRAVVSSFSTANWVSNWEPTGQNGLPGFKDKNALPTQFDQSRRLYPSGLNVTPDGAAHGNALNYSPLFKVDIEGDARINAWEIGADEYVGDQIDDNDPPTIPQNLSAIAVSASQIDLSWEASQDALGISEYRIYRDTNLVATTSATVYSDFELLENTAYSYFVVAQDLAENSSAPSESITTNTLEITSMISSITIQNKTFETQTGRFIFEFDAIPSGNMIDAVSGLAQGVADNYSDLAVITRFYTTGMIDVRNGAIYTADKPFPYTAGLTYSFRLIVDLPAHIYTVYVSEEGGEEQCIATDYAFRDEQKAVETLDKLAVVAQSGSHHLLNISLFPVQIPEPPSRLRIVPEQ